MYVCACVHGMGGGLFPNNKGLVMEGQREFLKPLEGLTAAVRKIGDK